MEELKIYRQSRNNYGMTVVRCSAEAYQTAQKIADETGQSIGKVASQLIMFAAKRVVILDEEV